MSLHTPRLITATIHLLLQVSTVDVAPTVLELAGVDVAPYRDELDGVSLAQYLESLPVGEDPNLIPAVGGALRSHLYIEAPSNRAVVQAGSGWKYVRSHNAVLGSLLYCSDAHATRPVHVCCVSALIAARFSANRFPGGVVPPKREFTLLHHGARSHPKSLWHGNTL